jgi:hypothetical protein
MPRWNVSVARAGSRPRRANNMTGTTRVALYHWVSTADQEPVLARVEVPAAAVGRRFVVTMDAEETASGASNQQGRRRAPS